MHGFYFKCNQFINPQVILVSLSDLFGGTGVSEAKTLCFTSRPPTYMMLYPELNLSELPFSYLLNHLYSLWCEEWNNEWESALEDWSMVQTQECRQWWWFLTARGSRHCIPTVLSNPLTRCACLSNSSPHENLSCGKVSSLFCCCSTRHPRSICLISKRVN